MASSPDVEQHMVRVNDGSRIQHDIEAAKQQTKVIRDHQKAAHAAFGRHQRRNSSDLHGGFPQHSAWPNRTHVAIVEVMYCNLLVNSTLPLPYLFKHGNIRKWPIFPCLASNTDVEQQVIKVNDGSHLRRDIKEAKQQTEVIRDHREATHGDTDK